MRAAIYCRLSEEDRNRGDADSLSIQNQKSMLVSFAATLTVDALADCLRTEKAVDPT